MKALFIFILSVLAVNSAYSNSNGKENLDNVDNKKPEHVLQNNLSEQSKIILGNDDTSATNSRQTAKGEKVKKEFVREQSKIINEKLEHLEEFESNTQKENIEHAINNESELLPTNIERKKAEQISIVKIDNSKNKEPKRVKNEADNLQETLKQVFSKSGIEIVTSQLAQKFLENKIEEAIKIALEELFEDVLDDNENFFENSIIAKNLVFSGKFEESIKLVFLKVFEEKYKNALAHSLEETFEDVLEYVMEELIKTSDQKGSLKNKESSFVYTTDSDLSDNLNNGDTSYVKFTNQDPASGTYNQLRVKNQDSDENALSHSKMFTKTRLTDSQHQHSYSFSGLQKQQNVLVPNTLISPQNEIKTVQLSGKIFDGESQKQTLNNLLPISNNVVKNLSNNRKIDSHQVVGVNDVTYTAAVIEYEPYNTWTDEEQGYGVVRQNALNIVTFAADAKAQGAYILIAPEYGIQSLDMQYNDTTKFLTYTQYVPDPSEQVVPCSMANDTRKSEAIQILSCGAIDNAMYIVADMAESLPCNAETIASYPWTIEASTQCPEIGYFSYNTQVVFDRFGTVIARYRKQNLFLEDYFTPGPLDDATAIFVTDFDVMFTLQICFDVVFSHPGYSNVLTYGIKDVAMSTAWVDQLPFDLADDSQNAFSRGLGINLLVSGYHLPERSKVGSGIYKGYSKEMPAYTYDINSGNVLLVSSVTTVAASSLQTSSDDFPIHYGIKSVKSNSFQMPIVGKPKVEDPRQHPIIHENLDNYTSVILAPGLSGEVIETEICSENNLCCSLSYQYTGNQTYMLIAFSGQTSVGYGAYFIGTQNCGIVWCRNSNPKTCAVLEVGLPELDSFGPYQLTSSSFTAETIYPTGVKTDLTLIGNDILNYEVNGYVYSISTNVPVENFLSSALHGRWYSNDA